MASTKIAVYNMKGGIGKSTISAQIAAGLAKEVGHSELLISCDGQNNSLNDLSYSKVSTDKNLYDLIKPDRLTVEDVIIDLNEGVKGIASESIVAITDILYEHREDLLSQFERMFPQDELAPYEQIIFDMGPGESHLNTMLLQACDYILMPVQLEYEGVDAIFTTYSYLDRIDVSRSKIRYVVPNLMDNTRNISKEVLKIVQEMFKDEDTYLIEPIPRRAIINAATSEGVSIFTKAPYYNPIVAPFYELIMDMIVNDGENRRRPTMKSQ